MKIGPFFMAEKEKAFLDACHLCAHGHYALDWSALDVGRLDNDHLETLMALFPKRTRTLVKKILGAGQHMQDLIKQEQFELEVLDRLKSGRFLDRLAFGGGTMLRLCYGLDRYSIDLDFWLLTKQEKMGYQMVMGFGFPACSNILPVFMKFVMQQTSFTPWWLN